MSYSGLYPQLYEARYGKLTPVKNLQELGENLLKIANNEGPDIKACNIENVMKNYLERLQSSKKETILLFGTKKLLKEAATVYIDTGLKVIIINFLYMGISMEFSNFNMEK